jgi:hypothetical protein
LRFGVYLKIVFQVLERLFQPPVLTPRRVKLAYSIAVGTDLLQLLLGPFGWTFADEIADVVAAILTWRLLGFHPLLLPTFVIEVIPIVDMFPTWTGCVALVVGLRKPQQSRVPPPSESGRIIDV